MAPKPKSSLLSHQPSKHKEEEEEEESEESSSGEEEEEEEKEEAQNSSDDETEADSSDNEAQNQVTPINHKPPTPAPKSDPKSDSGESESDSDADSEELPSDYKLQPIGKASESSSKRSHDEIQNSSLSSRKSLRSEEKKSASASVSASSPGGSIIRLWSNEDEIAVLNGMVEFKTAKGLDPNADMGAFHTFIKGKLKADYSRDQLRTKITRMKKRFVNALKKGAKGSDPVFSKPHEDLAFKISKKIWGANEKGEKEIKKVVEKDVVVEDEVVKREENGEGGDFWSKYPNINASFDSVKSSFPSLAHGGRVNLLKEKLSLIGTVKAKELDEKWKQLALEEVELNYKILSLMKEQVQMAMDQ